MADGSDEALKAMVEQIWSKYDLDGDGKLNLLEAKPYLKRYCGDELEMATVSNDFIEDTWLELDEDSKSSISKENMFNFLQRVWEEKQ